MRLYIEENIFNQIQLRKMTTSTVIQTIIVLAIVALALVYVLRRVIKITRHNSDCGCGCGKHCNHKKPKEY